MKSILFVKTFLGLVEMTAGLVNAGFSLPEWQAVKTIFFAPCLGGLGVEPRCHPQGEEIFLMSLPLAVFGEHLSCRIGLFK